jgi:hypothetical protein
VTPHEDTLEVRFNGGGSPALTDGRGAIVAYLRDPAWQPLLLAAPDIARELLATGSVRDGQWHTHECWAAQRGCIVECQQRARILTKAGVLP